MSLPSTPVKRPPGLRSPRTRQRSSHSSPSSTPPHSPALVQSRSLPHSPSTPHTTYQSFADIPPSPSSPHAVNGRFRQLSGGGAGGDDHDRLEGEQQVERAPAKRRGRKEHLTTSDLLKMTVGLAGAQLCWTVEMACVSSHVLLPLEFDGGACIQQEKALTG
jgi:hypothetical protein